MGNGRANSVLTKEEESIICEFRRKTWLPLDDLLDNLKPLIPNLSRSNLHRCLRHYGISTVPKEFSTKEEVKVKGKFKSYEIGFLHVDITEFYLCGKKHYLFVAIDRVTKMIYAKLYEQKRIDDTLDFMNIVFLFFPYKIHRVLTDNGLQFTYRSLPKNKQPRNKENILLRHPFTQLLLQKGIKHKLTAFYSPQTNGQVEKANDTLKKATINLFHYDTVQQFELNLHDYLNYYNCAKKLSALNRKSPYDFILQKYQISPNLFSKNPNHHCVGLNN
jgi:transposase